MTKEIEDNFVLDRIEALCKKRGWSHYKLAMESGVHQSSLYTLLNRKNTPNIYTLEKICSGFGMTLSQFFAKDNEYGDLTDEQKLWVEKLNSLSKKDLSMAMGYIDGLMDKNKILKGD
ncbi:MAG: helix-turn-helix transcriptional regulator [Phascolarctobacterium sp.]|nr:helix-turn-helix transcriptional regulator [Phascolarctobacterium sp.]